MVFQMKIKRFIYRDEVYYLDDEYGTREVEISEEFFQRYTAAAKEWDEMQRELHRICDETD